jgi:hypothetical protein
MKLVNETSRTRVTADDGNCEMWFILAANTDLAQRSWRLFYLVLYRVDVKLWAPLEAESKWDWNRDMCKGKLFLGYFTLMSNPCFKLPLLKL